MTYTQIKETLGLETVTRLEDAVLYGLERADAADRDGHLALTQLLASMIGAVVLSRTGDKLAADHCVRSINARIAGVLDLDGTA